MERKEIKMKKIRKFIISIAIVITIIGTHLEVFADVGGVQRYDNSTSKSSSSSSSSTSSDSFLVSLIFSPFGLIIIVGCGVGLFIWGKKKGIVKDVTDITKMGEVVNQFKNEMNFDQILGNNTASVAEQVRQIDPLFSEEKFLTWSKEVFIKLQNAWTKREWSIIRPFESNELFEQHASQLKEFIDTNRINVVEKINVQHASLLSFSQDGDKEYLSIKLKAVMRDYVIDASTKKVLQGKPEQDQYMSYKLTFMRKAGVKTQEGKSNHSTTNCPNCGAPTQITSAGQCEYCGSVITTGEHDWVLSTLEGI